MAEFNPQEFGRLQAQVEQLLESNRLLTESVSTMSIAVQSMQVQMAEARGGWKVLMAIGTASATAGGFASWAMTDFFGRG
jgi:hypothetical protein